MGNCQQFNINCEDDYIIETKEDAIKEINPSLEASTRCFFSAKEPLEEGISIIEIKAIIQKKQTYQARKQYDSMKSDILLLRKI